MGFSRGCRRGVHARILERGGRGSRRAASTRLGRSLALPSPETIRAPPARTVFAWLNWYCPKGAVSMKQVAYCLFETPLGSCGIAWGEGGNSSAPPAVTFFQLPE